MYTMDNNASNNTPSYFHFSSYVVQVVHTRGGGNLVSSPRGGKGAIFNKRSHLEMIKFVFL